MGKSSKKSASKVEVAPAVVATKPLKKGKREAEEAAEQVPAKKQKQNEAALKQAVAKKQAEAKTKKTKKVESSSEEDSSDESSEEDVKVKPAAKQPVKKVESSSEEDSSSDEETIVPAKVAKPAPKAKAASSSSESDSESESEEDEPKSKVPVKNVPAAKNGSVATKKKEESSDDSDSESEESEDEPKAKAPAKKVPAATVAKNGSVEAKKKADSSDESDSESEDDSDEEDVPKAKAPVKAVPAATTAKNGSVAAKKKADSSDDSDSDSEDDSDEEEETPAKVASKAAPVSSNGKDDTSESESEDESDESDSDEKPKAAAAKKDDSSDDESSEEESEEEDKKAPKTPKQKGGDVEMVDAFSAKSNIKNAPKTPSTPQVEATGSKTLFMGNLSFRIEESDVIEFFKDAGEVAEVRFTMDRETGDFRGFGHVEFATVEAAQKALKLAGRELVGREVRLDLARERGAFTPASGNENSYQKGGRAPASTIFVRGFDTSGGEEQVRNALQEHFGSCGDITRVSVPKDYEGGLKGIAYMDFSDANGLSKALELDGSELGGGSLTVEVVVGSVEIVVAGLVAEEEVVVIVVVEVEVEDSTDLAWLQLAQERKPPSMIKQEKSCWTRKPSCVVA
ncbi:hypothetical protein AgCh_032712 [Apium graveolens]